MSYNFEQIEKGNRYLKFDLREFLTKFVEQSEMRWFHNFIGSKVKIASSKLEKSGGKIWRKLKISSFLIKFIDLLNSY